MNEEIIEAVSEDLEESLSLDQFSFVTEIPETLSQRDYYVLGVKGFNLGLLLFMFLIAKWLISTAFGIFKPLFRKEYY